MGGKCRQVKDGDDVYRSLGHHNILQRFKLNGQTALVTGVQRSIHVPLSRCGLEQSLLQDLAVCRSQWCRQSSSASSYPVQAVHDR